MAKLKSKKAPESKPSRKRKPAPRTTATLEPRRLTGADLLRALAATELVTISRTTIGNWITAGCPRNADGTFDIVSVAAWLAAERRNREKNSAAQSKALERFRTARAKLSELELKIKTGELIHNHLVIDQFREIGLGVRNAFAAIERRHGRAVGDAIREALDNAFSNLNIPAA